MTTRKRIIKNIEILLSDEQAALLEDMCSSHDLFKISLESIIQTDANGLIVLFKPISMMDMALFHFIQNLMISQRLYLMDDFLRANGIIE